MFEHSKVMLKPLNRGMCLSLTYVGVIVGGIIDFLISIIFHHSFHFRIIASIDDIITLANQYGYKSKG